MKMPSFLRKCVRWLKYRYVLTGAQRAWIDALRSGVYSQATGALESDGGFCCLGVACLAFEQTTGQKVRRVDGWILGGVLERHPQVQEWLGLLTMSGCFEARPSADYAKDSRLITLTELNDCGKSFGEIADIIVDNARVLFYK